MTETTVWLTLDEAAAYSKFAPITILRAAKSGTLRGFRVGGGRTIWRFRAVDLDAWIQGSQIGANGT